ncbi:MAG TPA: ATP-binding cassette domain-containing protein [Gemmatimonadaceae bacterium]|nr:ATP-binding cassette domain-containing protein [Gemmatimonadaceae bacterium]
MPEPAIEIRNVVKRYDGHIAVRGLSLTVPRGTVYGILGPNGAGKTTTIRMVLDVIEPDEGTISVLGLPNTETGAIDRVGYLPEERGLYRRMQVRRVLRFLAELKGIGRREADRRIDGWLDRLGLRTADRDWGDAKVDDLSRGMQQKVQFIGALLHDPEMLILDEPFSGLDPINAQMLQDIVMELRRSGKTILFCTHMMDSAERLCDSVCIIAGGEKVLDGPVNQVREEHGGRRVELELSDGRLNGVANVLADRALVSKVDDANRTFEIELAPGADAQHLLKRLVESGANISRFELAQASLHRIFVERVGALHPTEEENDNA